MSIRWVVVLPFLVLTPWAVLNAADVTGKWTAMFTTQVGEQQYTYDFVVKGTVLTGTAKGDMLGEVKIEEGKVDGDKITFVENANFQGMPLKITYTGVMTSADEIKFTRQVADVATEQLVAKRAK